MRILFLSDVESSYLWDHWRPGLLSDIDLIISCGDLRAEYLTFLVTMANRPLLYVPGNHDQGYLRKPPEGCDNIDGKIVTFQGLRILGLGGSPIYNGGPYQYSDNEMHRKIRHLWLPLRRHHGVDLVVSHAAPLGIGDADDFPHRGFGSFVNLMDREEPALWVHGHIHLNYSAHSKREIMHGKTRVINAYDRYVVEI